MEEILYMKWPTGKYNGRRIAGLEIIFRVNVLWWAWNPRIYFKSLSSIHFLCFHIWINPEYER